MSFQRFQTGPEARDAALQEISDALVETGAGRPGDALGKELEHRIRQRGLPAMPPTWVHTVATQAAEGTTTYLPGRLWAPLTRGYLRRVQDAST